MARPTFEEAKAQYQQRFTLEHVPRWAGHRSHGGWYYAPQYETDREWYENTRFPGEGIPHSRDKHCMSRNQTWPLGEKLASPYNKEEYYGSGNKTEDN